MQIVIYDNQRIIDIFAGCAGVIVYRNNIRWQGGALEGISVDFAVVPDDVDVSTMSTSELVAADVSDTLKPWEDVIGGRVTACEAELATIMSTIATINEKINEIEQRITALEQGGTV